MEKGGEDHAGAGGFGSEVNAQTLPRLFLLVMPAFICL